MEPCEDCQTEVEESVYPEEFCFDTVRPVPRSSPCDEAPGGPESPLDLTSLGAPFYRPGPGPPNKVHESETDTTPLRALLPHHKRRL